MREIIPDWSAARAAAAAERRGGAEGPPAHRGRHAGCARPPDGTLTLAVPSIDVHEVVAIDL